MEWHSAGAENALKELNTSREGLSSEEAKFRLEKYGFNEIKEKTGISPLKILLGQFKSPLVWILIAAIIVSFIVQEIIDAVVIGVVLILNAALGFLQEYKAEKAIENLRKMEAAKAEVIRNNEKKMVDAKELVIGDIIILDEGDKIPADCRIIECYSLATIEAILTGESRSISKSIASLKEKTLLPDRVNMLFNGTMAVRGRAIAVVVATGMETQMGKIAGMIQKAPEKQIPLNLQLAKLGKYIGIGVLLLCAIIFTAEYFHDHELIGTLMVAIALAVAAVPEGLPAIATISFALGVQRMARKNALVRKLPSVETLGSTTVICTDKTGTLTMNEMTVRKILCSMEKVDVTGAGYAAEGTFSSSPRGIEMLLKAGMLCNNASIQAGTAVGDPTEAALVVSAVKYGLKREEIDKELPRVHEIPFSSDRKMMTTLNKDGKTTIAFSKGAPEMILQKCTKILHNGRIRPITRMEKNQLLKINEEFAANALRVLAFSYKMVTKKEDAEKEMIFIGLQGMIDPPRKEAKDAVLKCIDAGIRVVMITGDQKATAEAIASEVGIRGKILTGTELEEMNGNELAKVVNDVAVYARVSPEHKLKIIDALKKRGHIVAMTGDGINDAPALKKADIGIAVGSGTDVAKESSDMILLDDNFATIVNAVEEGRVIYDNIRKFSAYLISCNLAEVLIVFIAVLLSLPMPFVAIHLLWINLVTDSFPALAMGLDPAGKGIMKRKPRNSKEQIVSGNLFTSIIILAALVTGIVLYAFYNASPLKASTIAFTLLVALELAVPMIIRMRFRTYAPNYMLMGAILLSAVLQLAVVYSPLSKVFDTVALNARDILVIVLACVGFLIVGTAIQAITRKLHERFTA